MKLTQMILMALQMWGGLFAFTAALISRISGLNDTRHGRLIVKIEENCAVVSILSMISAVPAVSVVRYPETVNALLILSVLLFVNNICRLLLKLIDHDLKEKYAENGTEYNHVWVYYCHVLLGFSLLLSGLNYFNPLIVSIGSDGMIRTGELYQLSLIVLALFFVIVIAELISELRNFSIYELYMELLFCLMPLAALFLEGQLDCQSLLTIGLAFGSLDMFIFWQMDQVNEQAKLKLENEREMRIAVEENTKLMLSQVRPHFLYNSLASIQVLCRRDPRQAENGIKHLSAYLRRNLTSIEKPKMVTFKEELEQVEDYVWLENLRFEDALMINYEIEYDRFMIPAMSVMSIVEAAFAGGQRNNPDGMILDVRSMHKDGKIIVEVVDLNDDCISGSAGLEIYEGVEKSKVRIESLTGGTLKTVQTEDGQMKTTITIPDPAENGGISQMEHI